MPGSNKRSSYFDNAKFILIFLVVFGHAISPIKENNTILFTIYAVIFLFHMPAFIFISGYFSKGFNKKGYLLKVVKKILLPYFVFQILYSIFYYWNGDENKFTINLFQPHWSLWFLLSLFFWNLLLYIFSKFKWAGLLAASAIGMSIGYFDHVGGTLSLSRTFVFFPYFLLGHLLEPGHIKSIKKVKFPILLGSFILVSTTLLTAAYFPKDAIPWLLGNASYADMGTEAITGWLKRGGQYLITAVVIFGFLAIVPSGGFKISILGQRTFTIYLFHGFIIKTAQSIFSKDSLVNLADHYLTLLIFSMCTCILLGSNFVQKYTSVFFDFNFITNHFGKVFHKISPSPALDSNKWNTSIWKGFSLVRKLNKKDYHSKQPI